MESPTTSAPTEHIENTPQKRGLAFWLVFLAICISLFVSALDALALATALPTIVADLEGHEFVWVANAYSLASTAFLPWTGSLATIFGRKPIMLGSLMLFALGSGLCGGAKDMTMMIGGRTVQGLGSGGILAMTEIIVSDLVPLRERGPFFGIIGSVWAIASAVGPPVGGALAEKSTWRWIFYLNLPITGCAIILVTLFLNLRIPQETFRQKMARMDWIGNFLIIGGCTASILGLSWGGVSYPWSSSQTLVPLIIGLVALIVALVYEAKVPKEPTVPFDILSNRTTLSGYLTTCLHSICVTAMGYFLPVYFQSCKLASPLRSSIDTFGIAFSVAPAAILTGASVTILNRYVPQNYLGWVLITAGLGSWISLEVDTVKSHWVGVQILAGFGFGMLFPATNFVVLAPLPLSLNAHALAFYTFVRQFSMTWGTTIGSTILQNELGKRLPAEFLSLFPDGAEIAYAAIPQLPHLPADLRIQVQEAFADSLRVVWYAMVGISAAGLLACLLMKEVPMATVTDEQWGLQHKKKPRDAEGQTPNEESKEEALADVKAA